MTMYLPNGDVLPTGAEAGEFIDAGPGVSWTPPTAEADRPAQDRDESDGRTPQAPD